MSPDIEWRVGDEEDNETIAKTPPPYSSSRWWKVLFVFMVVAVIGLGIVYSDRPESTPHSTPTPLPPTATPQAIPAKLGETIDREVRALADGDFKTFLSLQDQSDGPWFQARSRTFHAWGRPLANHGSVSDLSRPLYTLVESGMLSFDHGWADVRQFRNGQYFRETRFYHRVNGQWLRTQPDLSLWSGKEQRLQTRHLEVSYPAEDIAFIPMVAQRFEAAYDQVCADLTCPGNAAPIHLVISPFFGQRPGSGRAQLDTIVLSSPRIVGMYDTVDNETARLLDDPVTGAAYSNLVSLLIQTTVNGIAWMSPDPTHDGNFFVSAVFYWESNRVSSHPDSSRLLPPPGLITNTQLVRLESLWDMQSTPSNPEQVASSVILFIEQKFGAPSVGQFLKAIGPARSFKQAIEASLGIEEAQFEQQWKDWLRRLPRALTPTPHPPTDTALLQDEGLLLFVCTQNRALCLMHPAGTDLQQVAAEGQYFWPRWSPDGRVFIALQVPEGPHGGIGDGGVVVSFSADGKRLSAYSFGSTDLLAWTNPTWSPNGQWLALTVAGDRNGDGLADPGEPYETLIFDRTTLRPAFAPLQGGVFDWSSAWSTDSRRLAYTYRIEGDGRYYLNPGTPTPQRRFTYKDCCSGLVLADVQQGSYEDAPGPLSIDLQPIGAWSPDGKWFAAVNASRLVVISAAHLVQRQEFPNVDEIDEVQWQPLPK